MNDQILHKNQWYQQLKSGEYIVVRKMSYGFIHVW
jgi:hypothetical protein